MSYVGQASSLSMGRRPILQAQSSLDFRHLATPRSMQKDGQECPSYMKKHAAKAACFESQTRRHRQFIC